MKKALIIVVSVIVILVAIVAIGIGTGALHLTPNTEGTSGITTYTEESN